MTRIKSNLREDLGVQAARAELEAGREANTKPSEGTQGGNESQTDPLQGKPRDWVPPWLMEASPWDFLGLPMRSSILFYS